ncbi:MAG: translation initiation factor IF-6 [Methanomassiliicoccales archaeon]|jgi:translation initiation factor 6|nr:translation initiation factor IF-6 [Methanomassiliicoccales archaeon]
MMKLSNYNGNPYIGVYCVANEFFSLIPFDSSKSLERDIEEALGVQVERCSIAGTNILGSLVAMNSYGAVVTNMASQEEIKVISKRIPVYRIEDKLNATGNNILVNDNAALVHPEIGKKVLRKIEKVLQVEVVQGVLAGHKTVGSVCIATNKGVLCHPNTKKEELEMIRSLFKVPASIGTLNYGTPIVRACLVANSRGAAVGFKSTPIELGRVEDALGLV